MRCSLTSTSFNFDRIVTDNLQLLSPPGNVGSATEETIFLHCRVPDEDPSGHSMILPFGEYYRIKMASRVLTEGEKIAEWEERKREKENAMVSLNMFSVS